MSGEDGKDTQAQDTPTKKDKEVIRVPICWLHPHIVEMLHTVDTWKQFELDESLGGDDTQGLAIFLVPNHLHGVICCKVCCKVWGLGGWAKISPCTTS